MFHSWGLEEPGMEISVKLQKDFCGEQAIRATEFVEFCIDHYLIIGLNHLHIAEKKPRCKSDPLSQFTDQHKTEK